MHCSVKKTKQNKKRKEREGKEKKRKEKRKDKKRKEKKRKKKKRNEKGYYRHSFEGNIVLNLRVSSTFNRQWMVLLSSPYRRCHWQRYCSDSRHFTSVVVAISTINTL
jgi:FtsZ-interacting cell division protein YlmF